MVRGPDGMWYRAARYDTQEECAAFLGTLKPALAARKNPGDNLLTISFGTPEGKNYVVALGYPTPETIALAESLFEKPPVTLSQKDLTYARQQVTKLRRGAGMSDQEASARALERTREMGLPEPFARSIASDFIEGLGGDRPGEPFTAQLAQPSPAMPGLQAGAKLAIQRLPFIVGYQQLSAMDVQGQAQDFEDVTQGGARTVATAMNAIIDRKLRRADKYQFNSSAIAMLETVRDSGATTWLPLKNNLWIEFTQALNTLHGSDVKALWAHDMNMASLIPEVAPASRDRNLHDSLMGRSELYKAYWSFNVITARCAELFDFTYEPARERWVYLASHKCPSGQCTYPRLETYRDLGECSPCLECQNALAYWASVLHTAIRIVRREYALAPEEPAPYPLAPESYTEETRVKVGKGKNARHIKQMVTREIAYRLVSFEVSEITPAASALGAEIIEREEQAAQLAGESKRPNWLTLAGDRGGVVWEYREIDTSKGRTLVPGPGKPWKAYKHLDIAPFKKWVPMLSKERKTIKKVTARRYAQEPRKEQ